MWLSSWGRLLALTYLLQAGAANFTFTSYSEATECDNFDVSWTGGSPPFWLTILPAYNVQTHVDIPPKAFSNNSGSYTVTMPVRAGNKTVVILSDSTGFGSGGVTPLITVGKSKSDATCSPPPRIDYTFDADSALRQCEGYVFQEYDQAIQPITITGVIPGGSTFVLNPPNGSKSFTWIADVAADTQLLFFMTDSQGRQGGTTSLLTAQHGEDSTCLDNNSPTSTTNPPSSTAAPTSTGTVSASSSTSHIKTSTLIVAIVVPVVAVMALILGTCIWYRRRRSGGVRDLGRRFHQPEVDLAKGDSNTPQHMREAGSPHSAIPFFPGGSPIANGSMTLGNYSPPLPTSATSSQFPQFLPHPTSVYSDSTHGYPYGAMSAYGSSHGGSSQYGGASEPAVPYAGGGADGDRGARRKAAEAGVLTPPGHQAPAQFILHTDIEDSAPPPVREVVELPPQYSERRAGTPAPADDHSSPPA